MASDVGRTIAAMICFVVAIGEAVMEAAAATGGARRASRAPTMTKPRPNRNKSALTRNSGNGLRIRSLCLRPPVPQVQGRPHEHVEQRRLEHRTVYRTGGRRRSQGFQKGDGVTSSGSRASLQGYRAT